jgi:hypothetical protein
VGGMTQTKSCTTTRLTSSPPLLQRQLTKVVCCGVAALLRGRPNSAPCSSWLFGVHGIALSVAPTAFGFAPNSAVGSGKQAQCAQDPT